MSIPLEENALDDLSIDAHVDSREENCYSYQVEFDPDVMSEYSTVRKKKNPRVKMTEMTGPGHHCIFRTIQRKYTPVEIYTTRHTPGALIRNAKYGDKEQRMYVGKPDEKMYFKVKLATGELGADPYGTHLYYDSPEQFERHFFTKVSQTVKNQWWDSSNEYKRILTQQLHKETAAKEQVIR